MKTIVMTGGGTAGHITPNIALLPGLRAAGFDIRYIGLRGGMEQKLIEAQGVPFYGISGGKLRRYFDLKNFTDLFRTSKGFVEARGLIRRLKPDIVFSKGGFVSTPVVWAASAAGVPVVSHESDMTIGLANRLSLPFAKKVCYTFPETGEQMGRGKGVLTGLPIREELLHGSRRRGLEACGFVPGTPVLLIIGGSLGSGFINKIVRSSLPRLLPSFQVCHIAGRGNLDPALENRAGYRQFEYVTELLPDLFAAADIVLTRGGATSLMELLALNKPHIIIPYSLKASRGDQILNAESFRRQGFCEVLAESAELTESEFLNTVIGVWNNRARYAAAMEKSPVRDGVGNVLSVLLETAEIRQT